MEEIIVKPSKQLRLRAYFILLALFFSTASVLDYRLKNQLGLNVLEFFIFVIISIFLFLYFIFSLGVSIKMCKNSIECALFNVKLANSSSYKVKVIRNKFILYMLKSDDAIYVSSGEFFFTLSDSWENFQIFRSQLALL